MVPSVECSIRTYAPGVSPCGRVHGPPWGRLELRVADSGALRGHDRLRVVDVAVRHQNSATVTTDAAVTAIPRIVPSQLFVVYDPPAALSRTPAFATAAVPKLRYTTFAPSLTIVTSRRPRFADRI